MKEQILCPICNKKRWSDVTIIEVGNKEDSITVECPKCKAKLKKIIAIPKS